MNSGPAAGRLAIVSLAAVLVACASPDEPVDPFGYDALRRELGNTVPDGSGVAVQLVESSADIKRTVDGVEKKIGTGFAPNAGSLEFSGKDIRVSPIVVRDYSGHATGMGGRFFGNISSLAPGITEIHAFESMFWLGVALNVGRNRLPLAYPARISNHSWVGSADHPELPGTRNLTALRRVDWLVATDEFVQVAGFNGNRESPLLSSAWNVVSVSHVDGAYPAGAANVGSPDYPEGRTRPHVVVSEKNPSSATARVSSAAALLIETGHADAALSNDPAGDWTTNRNGDRIFNAERVEIVKAALMAGADRAFTGGGLHQPERAPNGLDRHFGAGRLNVHGSYGVIAGGERNSVEDEPEGGGALSGSGFDYDPEFGGRGGSNARGTYYLSGGADLSELTATLAWNAQVTSGFRLGFDAPVEVVDIDLHLFDVSDADVWLLIASSEGRGDNTESLHAQLAPGADYVLQVRTAPGQAPFEWDYGLAWKVETPGAGSGVLGMLND